MLAPMSEEVGAVELIDETRQRISVRVNRMLRTFLVDETTTVFVQGRTGNLSDLSPGQIIRASYEPGQEPPTAQWLEVEPSKGRP
jgi:hypothetical protein